MPGSTRREIREAYARLAKEYHPEEHPKKFNQIQEAYQLLTGRGKTGRQMRWMTGFQTEKRRNLNGNQKKRVNLIHGGKRKKNRKKAKSRKKRLTRILKRVMQQKNPGKGQKKTQKIYRKMRSRRLSRKKKLLNRREKIQRHIRISVTGNSGLMRLKKRSAREQWKREAETQRRKMDWQREQEKLQEQTRRAIRDSLYELELILEDKRRRNRTELYEPFFFRRENKAVMLQEAYVSGLIDLLEKYSVKRKVYLTLQKIYSGSGAESAKVLIRYLEQKNKKETPNVWGAAAFAAIGISQLQGICGEEWKSSFSTMLMLIVVILGLGILYAGLRTHYSVGISQIWIAGILFWLSFLGLITTISDNLFWDADTGIFLAVMVWFESIIWMVILGIRAIVLKIKNRR